MSNNESALMSALRTAHPDLVEHFDEVNNWGLMQTLASEETTLQRTINNAIKAAIDEAVERLAGDFAGKVDQAWWTKRLGRGVEHTRFSLELKRYSYTGTVYQVVYGHLDDEAFHEDESMDSYVYGTLEMALKCATSSRFHHARIFREYVDGNELPNEGPDMTCYPPDSYGNRTSQWTCMDFDGKVHAIGEDGQLKPFSMTWRMLRDAINGMDEDEIDTEAYVWVYEENIMYDGIYMLAPHFDRCDTDPDSPYAVDVLPY